MVRERLQESLVGKDGERVTGSVSGRAAETFNYYVHAQTAMVALRALAEQIGIERVLQAVSEAAPVVMRSSEVLKTANRLGIEDGLARPLSVLFSGGAVHSITNNIVERQRNG